MNNEGLGRTGLTTLVRQLRNLDNQNVKINKASQSITGDLSVSGSLSAGSLNIQPENNNARIVPAQNGGWIYWGDPNQGKYYSGVDFNNRVKILNIPVPVNLGDAANKQYVDQKIDLIMELIKSIQTQTYTPKEGLLVNVYGDVFLANDKVGQNAEITGSGKYSYAIGGFVANGNDIPNWRSSSNWANQEGTQFDDDQVVLDTGARQLMIGQQCTIQLTKPDLNQNNTFSFCVFCKHEKNPANGSIFFSFSQGNHVWRNAIETKWDGYTFAMGNINYGQLDITQWHTYGFTYANRTGNLYVDGIKVASGPMTIATGIRDINLFYSQGRAPATNPNRYPANKSLKSLRLWSRALTDAEMSYVSGLDRDLV